MLRDAVAVRTDDMQSEHRPNKAASKCDALPHRESIRFTGKPSARCCENAALAKASRF